MDLDQLQKRWQNLDVKPVTAPDIKAGAKSAARHGMLNLNERLYRRMLISCFSCILSIVMIWPFAVLIGASELTVVCYIVFFIIMSLTYAALANRISRSTYLTMPVVAAVKEVAHREILMRRVKLMGRILSVPVLVLIFLEIYRDSQASGDSGIVGGIVGGVVGLFVGLRYERSNRRIIRQIRQTLEEEIGDDTMD